MNDLQHHRASFVMISRALLSKAVARILITRFNTGITMSCIQMPDFHERLPVIISSQEITDLFQKQVFTYLFLTFNGKNAELSTEISVARHP